MASKTDIANAALRRIGAKRIASLDSDTTKEAVVCRDLYDFNRRMVLNANNWNFAIKRVQLAASTTTPAFGRDYNFPLPDDFIRMISVHPSDTDNSVVEYRLETTDDNERRNVVTNTNQAYIRYVWDVENVNMMSPMFRDVLAWRLAADLALALPQKVTLADRMETIYDQRLRTARAQDGVEDYPEEIAEGSWIRDRLGKAEDFIVSN